MFRPRLAVLTSTFPLDDDDGTPLFVFELCRRLAADFDITVIAPNAPNARSGSWAGFEVVRYRYAPRRWERLAGAGGILGGMRRQPLKLLLVPLLLLGQAWALWRRRREFDLIHAHWLFPQGLIAVLAGGGAPVICTSHGADVFALRGGGWDAVRRFVLLRAKATTAVGLPLIEALRPLAPTAKICQLPMGVDLCDRFVPDASTRPLAGRLLFVGRLVEKKGVGNLLDALSILAREYPNLDLDVIGDGPLHDQLLGKIVTLGLSGRVHLLGAVPNRDLPKRYRKAELVVLPFLVADDGDTEGLGLTLVEALGCGCKVVVGRSLAQEELVRDCTGLWTCNAKNPADLAAAIRGSLGQSLSPLALRADREARLAPYDWSAVAQGYGRLLGAVADRFQGAKDGSDLGD